MEGKRLGMKSDDDLGDNDEYGLCIVMTIGS